MNALKGGGVKVKDVRWEYAELTLYHQSSYCGCNFIVPK